MWGARQTNATMTPEEPIKLYRYNPETMMPPDVTVVVVGPRGSGKTVFMKYVMFCMRDKLDVATFFCPSRDVRQEFEAFLPKSHIHADFSKTRLKQVCDAQAKLAALCPGRRKDQIGSGGVPLRNIGLVLDDCMSKKAVFESETVRAIMNNGRHDNIFFMNGVQYIMSVPKEQRSQIDIAVCFPHAGAFLKAVNDNLMGDAFDSVEMCGRAFQQLRENECLVYDARAKRRKQPFLFYCKAQHDLPDFMVGCDFFWRLYYKHMVRAKVDTHREILETMAKARGEALPPDDDASEAAIMAAAAARGDLLAAGAGGGVGAAAAAGAGAGVRVVLRMPPTATVPMLTGPAGVGVGAHAATAAAAAAAALAAAAPLVAPKIKKNKKRARKLGPVPTLALKSIL